jgi:hypothetical protein
MGSIVVIAFSGYHQKEESPACREFEKMAGMRSRPLYS